MGPLDSEDSWGPESLLSWTTRTASWSEEASLRGLKIAVDAAQSARIALTLLLQLDCSATCEDFERAFRAKRLGLRAPGWNENPTVGRETPSVAARTAAQLNPPASGSEAWENSAPQGAHAALLLAHTIVELLGLLVRLREQPRLLSADLPLLQDQVEIQDALLGGKFWLAAEGQSETPVWSPRFASGLLPERAGDNDDDDFSSVARLEEILTCGAASTTDVTGHNLRARWRWQRP